MKKYLLAAAISSLASTASALCTYPLDATPEQYAYMSPQVPFPSVNFQSVEYVAQSTVDGTGNLRVVNYQALSDTMMDAAIASASTGLPGGDITLPTSGIVAFEWQADHFPASEADGANLYLSAGFASSNAPQVLSGGNDGLSVSILLGNTNYGQGTFATAIAAARNAGVLHWGGHGTHDVTLPLSANYRIGIYLNMNTRQVGYTLNGVDHGYLQDEQGGAFLIPSGVSSIGLGFSGVMQVMDNNPLAGTPVGGTLITDKSQFTQPFPAGTTDICNSGGDSGGGLKLQNGKPYPGKANPRGLQKFQPLLLPAKPLGLLLKQTQ